MATSSKASSSLSAGRSERSSANVAIAGVLVAVCIAAALLLASCKNVLNNSEDSFHLRVVNLLEDSPTVQYSVDATAISTAGYLGATALGAVRPGSHKIGFTAIRPSSLNSADTTDPIVLGGSFDQSYVKDQDYTVFAYGKLNDVHTFLMNEASGKPAVDNDFFEYQIVNAAPGLANADVYVTAPDAQITTPTKVATVAFGGKTDTFKVKLFQRADVTDTTAALFTDLTIELRDPTSGAVLFTSNKVRVTEQTRMLFAVANNVSSVGPSTVQMLGIDGFTGSLLSIADQSAVRIVHVSSDTPALDVIRGSSLSTPIASNLTFGTHSPYVNVPQGDVDIVAVPTGNTSVFLFVKEFTAVSNGSYSAYAVGPLATVDANVLQDSRRSVPTQSQFRFLNAAPSQNGGDGVDIYVTLPGQSLDFNASTTVTTDDAAQFKRGAALTFRNATDYVVLKSGTYQVRFTATATSQILLDTTITTVDGSVETLVFNDDPAAAGSQTLTAFEEALP